MSPVWATMVVTELPSLHGTSSGQSTKLGLFAVSILLGLGGLGPSCPAHFQLGPQLCAFQLAPNASQALGLGAARDT